MTPSLAAELGMQGPRALRETKNFQAWLRLMRGGAPLEPRLIQTSPPQATDGNRLDRVIARSRSRHTVPRVIVEAQIDDLFSKVMAKQLRPKSNRRNPDG